MSARVRAGGGSDCGALDSGLSGFGTLTSPTAAPLFSLTPADRRPAMYDGPSYVAVDNFKLGSDGALTIQLQPLSGGVQAVGSYSQVFADTVKLDGTLEADLATSNGLFANSYDWQNVIDANSLSGSFDQCKLGGDYAGSLFLKFNCSVDSNSNVDLSLTRVGFDNISGLNANGRAVAGALEADYPSGSKFRVQRPPTHWSSKRP